MHPYVPMRGGKYPAVFFIAGFMLTSDFFILLWDGEPAKNVLAASFVAYVPAIETNLLNFDVLGIKVYLAAALGDSSIVSRSLDEIWAGLWLSVASFESMLGKAAKS